MRPIDPREFNAQGDRIVKQVSPHSDVSSDEEGKSYRKSKILNSDSDPSWVPPENPTRQKRTSKKRAYKDIDSKSSARTKLRKTTSSGSEDTSSSETHPVSQQMKGKKYSEKNNEPRGKRNVSQSEQGGAKEQMPKFNMVNIQRQGKTLRKEGESKPQGAPAKFPTFRMVENQRDRKTGQTAIQEPMVTSSDSKTGTPEVPRPVFKKVNVSKRKCSKGVDNDEISLETEPVEVTGSTLLKDTQLAPIILPVEIQPNQIMKKPQFKVVPLSPAPAENKQSTKLVPKQKDIVMPRFRFPVPSGLTGNKKRLANMLPKFSMVGSSAAKKTRSNMGSSLNAPVIPQGVPRSIRANTTSKAVRMLEEQGAKVVVGNTLGEIIDESSIREPTRKQGRNKKGKPFLGFMCQDCGEVFERVANYNRHALSKHPTVLQIYQCPFCPSRLAGPRQYNDHLKRSHKEGPPTLPCPHCDMMFKYSQARHSHVLNKHNKEI